MKAWVLHSVGDLRLEEVATPRPEEGEVLLRVAACGICGSDIPRIFTKGTYDFPTIPGHEFSGVVEEAAPGVDPGLVGSRVAVFPLLPCRDCALCAAGAYAQCENYRYLGSRCDGAFAEYVTVPAWNLLRIPDTLTFEEAAMVEPAAVALHALRRASVDMGDSVLIFGAGPIGLMLGMWARAWGARKVLLIDIDVERLRFAKSVGFTHLLDGRDADVPEWVKQKTGHGADVVVEGSGSTAAFEQCVLSARPFGAVVLMGNPQGGMGLSQQAYWAVLRNELRVLGTWNSSFAEMPRNEWKLALACMASGELDVKPLITHRTDLEGLWDHLVMMRDHSAFFSKVMLLNAFS